MTGLNADSIRHNAMQFGRRCSRTIRRHCSDCGSALEGVAHGNKRLCDTCRKRHHATREKLRAARGEVSAHAVVAYMTQHAPRALADVKERIKKERFALAR